MPMTKSSKIEKVATLEKVLADAKGVYLADFNGMTVEVISELRKRCRKSDVRMEVVKNTLLKRAAQATGNEALTASLSGSTALVTSETDQVVPAKILVEFAKEFKLPQVKRGMIDGRALSAQEVEDVSALPPKDVLLGQLAGTLQAPLKNFVSAITSPLRDLAGVLNALAEKKEGAA